MQLLSDQGKSVDLLPNPVLDVERELDVAVRNAGGCRVDALVGQKPGHRAADYIFDSDKVIAELKCLEKDQINDPKFIEKTTDLYLRNAKVDRSIPRIFGTVTLESSRFSEDVQRQLAELYLVPISRAIRSANQQIDETKVHLKRDEHLGVLLLVNDGNTALHPGNVCWALFESLKSGDFPHINHVIFFTVNLPVDGAHASFPPGASEMDVHVWFTAGRDGFRQIPSGFEPRLRNAWFGHLEAIHGRHMSFDGDTSMLNELRNKPRSDRSK